MNMELVSVIIPVYNAVEYVVACLDSVMASEFTGELEICVYDDGSDDGSHERVVQWRDNNPSVRMVLERNTSRHVAHGAGHARNQAIARSSGGYLCMQDADDLMSPDRVQLQYLAASRSPEPLCIVGSNFVRLPEGSAARYSGWLNSLTQEQLITQRFKEITMIQPTWFMSRSTFQRIGRYSVNLAEDMDYFYRALDANCSLIKVEKPLLTYRWHADENLSSKTHRNVLTEIKARSISAFVCSSWRQRFMIWGCGRDAKKLYRALTPEARALVSHFGELHPNKIGNKYDGIPIIHRDNIGPPFLCCVALQRSNGMEEQLERFVEGVDYFQCV